MNSAKTEDAHRIDACQAPYLRQLVTGPIKLYTLYEKGTLMEQYQTEVAPVAQQLAALADAWARLQLPNRLMNGFAHALAAEFDASLTFPRFDGCAFVRDIAAHHFSYAWARRSAAGRLEQRYWTRQTRAGDSAGRFWTFFFPIQAGQSAPGEKLFTRHQLGVLANLPGELG